MFVEAAIDFPEEEIDFLNDGKIQIELNVLLAQLEKIQAAAKRGKFSQGTRTKFADWPSPRTESCSPVAAETFSKGCRAKSLSGK